MWATYFAWNGHGPIVEFDGEDSPLAETDQEAVQLFTEFVAARPEHDWTLWRRGHAVDRPFRAYLLHAVRTGEPLP
jgi:hypothetical protein